MAVAGEGGEGGEACQERIDIRRLNSNKPSKLVRVKGVTSSSVSFVGFLTFPLVRKSPSSGKT